MKGFIKIGTGVFFLSAIFCCSISYSQTIRFYPTPQNKLLTAGLPGAYSAYSLPSDFYANQLGFFCKKEWEMEKSIRLPLRLRIGDLAQLNKWEGKRY